MFYTNIIFYFLIFFVFVYASDIYVYRDVCYYAKIRILRQIIDLMINIVCNKNIRSTSMGEGCG